ncbi:MAG: hypothetical protein AB7E61_07725 [Acholeplasmataceae bacterium]
MVKKLNLGLLSLNVVFLISAIVFLNINIMITYVSLGLLIAVSIISFIVESKTSGYESLIESIDKKIFNLSVFAWVLLLSVLVTVLDFIYGHESRFAYLLLTMFNSFIAIYAIHWMISIYVTLARFAFTKKLSEVPIKTTKPEVKTEVENDTPLQQGHVVMFEQEDIVLSDIKKRPKFIAFQMVDNGHYLELEPDYSTSNKVIQVENRELPRLIHPDGFFVSITNEEKTKLSLQNINFASFIKHTPGSFRDAGYYLEVDLNNQSTEYYIYTEKRLPPTRAKGYRWVRVNSRKVS